MIKTEDIIRPQGWLVSFFYPNQVRLNDVDLFQRAYAEIKEGGEIQWTTQVQNTFLFLRHHHRSSRIRDLRIATPRNYPFTSETPALDKPEDGMYYKMHWPSPIFWSHTGPKGMVSTNLDLEHWEIMTGTDMVNVLDMIETEQDNMIDCTDAVENLEIGEDQ